MGKAGQEAFVQTFRREIAHDEQGRYIEIPFRMPEGTETLHVAYSVESFSGARAVIDLGIRDGERVRGWSGGARKEFRIGLERATPGYHPGGLTPGEWAVLHNAYQVPEEGCAVIVTVTCVPEEPRWLKGDLHMHSVHSDGSFTLEENAAAMEALGCDFLAMTDHNTTSQNKAHPRNTELVLIPGMELTTNFGHSNMLGVADPVDDFRAASQEEIDLRIRTARERGARIVLNHPHCDHCPWLWSFDGAGYDWVEVWNGPWREANRRTLDWWQEQLASGRRLVAVGGSDTHKPHPFVRHAMPTTWVYAKTKTVAGILEGLERGHAAISYAPDGPFLEWTFGPYRTGDVVPAENDCRKAELRASRLQPGDRIRVVGSCGVLREWEAGGEPKVVVPVSVDGSLFLRAEAWRWFPEAGDTLLAAMTNPIYFAKG